MLKKMDGDRKNIGVRFIEPAGKFPKRKDLRLKGYDYKSNGYYFVTICTHRGRPNIERYKEAVERILLSLPEQFSGLSIDWYVLMSTSLHVILIFDGMKKGLPEVVRTFKALVTRDTGVKFWQRNYYEHVIKERGCFVEDQGVYKEQSLSRENKI